MEPITPGQPAPDFTLPATGGKEIHLADLRGQIVVLYFYPRDNTPGCTTEGQNFRDLHDAFSTAGAVVLGISRDGLKTHENFKAKQGFPFDLISDSEEQLCQRFEVMKDKNMYGKKVRGIERSTFLIDAEGIVRRVWRKVKIEGHAEEVLAAVRAL